MAGQTKEEVQRQQEEAEAQLQALIDGTRPKNLGEGISSGVSNIVVGAVGGVGIALLAPAAGFAAGANHAGLIGGALGLAGGAVAGALAGAAMITGGAISGAGQIIRGVGAVPGSVIEPRRGKWWSDTEGKWIYTDLKEEEAQLKQIPEDDDDILGAARKEAEAAAKTKEESGEKKEVKDTTYYDILEVDPSADQSKIRRQYYVLARKYHPDKVGADDKEAADKFKDIAEAYQVLSDPELRATYDKDGKDGLSPDKTETASAAVVTVDPALLFAFLFGSDKFNGYVGRLAMATSASVADSPEIGIKEAKTLQHRRCARLALLLAERLQPWVNGECEMAKTTWTDEAAELSKASFGPELVHLVGQVYNLSAVQFMGAFDSGVGFPSIRDWAASQKAETQKKRGKSKASADQLIAGMNMMKINQKAASAMRNAKTDEEKKAVEESSKKEMYAAMLDMMWKVTVVDITSTLHETVQMVLFDQSVDVETRKKRAEGLKQLGQIFMDCPAKSDQPEDVQHMYEDAAYAAVLETIKRKEEATHAEASKEEAPKAEASS